VGWGPGWPAGRWVIALPWNFIPPSGLSVWRLLVPDSCSPDPLLQIGFWGVFVALCAARSHMDSVAADGWLDSPGPFSW